MPANVAVITGGTGFIGWNLGESLRDSGWEVRAVVRPSSPNALPDRVQRIDCELDEVAMSGACEGAAIVYHLAGLTRAIDYESFARVNIEGARQAALAARRAEAFFVLVSSQAGAGAGTPEHPRTEKHQPAPLSSYGKSKLAGERAVQKIEGLRYAIIRPPGVYGPRDRDFLALFRGGKRGLCPVLGDAESAYTLIHVADLVAGLRAVGETGAAEIDAVMGETFFVGHAEPVRQVDFARLLSEAYDRRVRVVPVPRWLLYVIAEAGELSGRLTGRPALLNRDRLRELGAPGLVCEVAKIERAVGHVARIDAAQGFEDTADWYRQHGWL